METWLPPQGMTGRMVNFDFREGGAYRMRLTYNEPQHVAGKTSADADEVEVRFVKLVDGERIEQAVTFDSEDSAFSGRDANYVGIATATGRNRCDRELRKCTCRDIAGGPSGGIDLDTRQSRFVR